jgi:stringent starvation protein B
VLNIGEGSVLELQISNELVQFTAKFSGLVHDVRIPVTAVLAIFSVEASVGEVFCAARRALPVRVSVRGGVFL